MAEEEQKEGGARRFLWGASGLITLLSLFVGWYVLVAAVFPADRIDEMQLVTTADGRGRLFVTEITTHSADEDDLETTRLAVYDLARGERKSRRVLRWATRVSVTVLGPAPAGIWVYETSNGPQILDPNDGSILSDAPELLTEEQLARILREGDLDERVGYFAETRSAILTMNDGSRLALAADGSTTPFTAQLPERPSRVSPTGVLWLDLGDERRVGFERREGDAQGAARLADSGAVYLGASFVHDTEGQPIVLDSPESALVFHAATLESDSESRVSRVPLDGGEPLWTFGLGAHTHLELAHRSEDSVVVVTAEDELVAISLDRGAERYREDLAW